MSKKRNVHPIPVIETEALGRDGFVIVGPHQQFAFAGKAGTPEHFVRNPYGKGQTVTVTFDPDVFLTVRRVY